MFFKLFTSNSILYLHVKLHFLFQNVDRLGIGPPSTTHQTGHAQFGTVTAQRPEATARSGQRKRRHRIGILPAGQSAVSEFNRSSRTHQQNVRREKSGENAT